MANIAGRYGLTINITNAQYTFTDNNRDASFTPQSPDIIVPANCAQIFNYGAQALAYGESDFIINRARIISSGAPGLQPPELKRAANINFVLCKQDGTILDSTQLKIQNWNEWTDINAVLKPYKNNPTWDSFELNNNKPVYFCPKYINSLYCLDDYNLQSAYVGQTFTPILELDVEATGGMVDSYNFGIF